MITIAARVFRRGVFLWRHAENPRPGLAGTGYSKPSMARGSCPTQIRKQFLLHELMLRAVGQALDRDHSGGEFIFAQDYSVARLQAIREAQRFSELHLDCRQLDDKAPVLQPPCQLNAP